MSRDVVAVSSRQTMAHVADLFVKHGISGAPVVDEQGRCVGIVSALDFVRRERALRRADQPLPDRRPCSPTDGGAERPPAREAAEDLAGAHMTGAVQSVSPGASLYKAAQMMCVQHIHRLPVLDQEGRLVGLVTSMDVMSAMINAIDEGSLFAG
jgi:CBS-domain-containing membrane protein